jgi:hypothetical protein
MSVICFARNYASNAAPRVRHIALPRRDQMDLGMFNCLSRNLSAIRADIETCYRSQLSQIKRSEGQVIRRRITATLFP